MALDLSNRLKKILGILDKPMEFEGDGGDNYSNWRAATEADTQPMEPDWLKNAELPEKQSVISFPNIEPHELKRPAFRYESDSLQGMTRDEVHNDTVVWYEGYKGYVKDRIKSLGPVGAENPHYYLPASEVANMLYFLAPTETSPVPIGGEFYTYDQRASKKFFDSQRDASGNLDTDTMNVIRTIRKPIEDALRDKGYDTKTASGIKAGLEQDFNMKDYQVQFYLDMKSEYSDTSKRRRKAIATR